MTQKELQELYDKLLGVEDEDFDAGQKQYWKEIKKMGYCISGDWKEHADEDFIGILENYGFKVLTDPQWEGSDQWGYVIIPPKGLINKS